MWSSVILTKPPGTYLDSKLHVKHAWAFAVTPARNNTKTYFTNTNKPDVGRQW